MHDPERMQEPNAEDQLLRDLRSTSLLQKLRLLDEFEEVDSLDELCDDVDVRLGLDALPELQQQRVRHSLHYAALVAESSGLYAISARA